MFKCSFDCKIKRKQMKNKNVEFLSKKMHIKKKFVTEKVLDSPVNIEKLQIASKINHCKFMKCRKIIIRHDEHT